MDEKIWDAYGDWSQFATGENLDMLRTRITATPGRWVPNFCSPTLRAVIAFAAPASIVDFGAGLGRNLPLLRTLAPRVVACDLPEMVARLRTDASDVAALYSGIFTDPAVCAALARPEMIYDSVVFQHISDDAYAAELMVKLLAPGSVRAIVSVHNTHVTQRPIFRLLRDAGWTEALSETDEQSFAGVPHLVVVFRRP